MDRGRPRSAARRRTSAAGGLAWPRPRRSRPHSGQAGTPTSRSGRVGGPTAAAARSAPRRDALRSTGPSSTVDQRPAAGVEPALPPAAPTRRSADPALTTAPGRSSSPRWTLETAPRLVALEVRQPLVVGQRSSAGPSRPAPTGSSPWPGRPTPPACRRAAGLGRGIGSRAPCLPGLRHYRRTSHFARTSSSRLDPSAVNFADDRRSADAAPGANRSAMPTRSSRTSSDPRSAGPPRCRPPGGLTRPTRRLGLSTRRRTRRRRRAPSGTSLPPHP